MTPRSWLFVPGDSERKLDKAEASGADALILDLEDSVALEAKARARDMVAAYLAARPVGQRKAQLWVRVNPLETPFASHDLAAVVGMAPDGIVLPKVEGPVDVEDASLRLDRFEAEAGVAAGTIRILPIATETARAPFRMGDYDGTRLARLAGLTWGAEDLSAALGAHAPRDAAGELGFTYRMVRSLALLGAHAAGVPAIETLDPDYRDEDGLRASSRAAYAEGFSGRLAIHPAQVAPINDGFTPTAEEVARARALVEAFAAAGDPGTLGLDGRMYDRPHLLQARRLLSVHEAMRERIS